jgi:hypothetical protein
MAQNTDITLSAGAWTLLANSDATSIRVTNLSDNSSVLLKGTVGATPPSDSAGAVILGPLSTITADYTLASLFPGISGVNRLYAYSPKATVISISHA